MSLLPPPAPVLDDEVTDLELLRSTQEYLRCRQFGARPDPSSARAWEQFYRIYTPQIRAEIAARRVPDPDREDCLQEVWKEIIAGLDRFEPDPRRGRLSTWLYALTRNKAVDAIRRRLRRPAVNLDAEAGASLPGRDLDPAAEYERRRLQALVRGALDDLSRQFPGPGAQVLRLRWIEGLTVPEIARVLALTPEQVRVRHHRALKKLRDLFEASSSGPGASSRRNSSAGRATSSRLPRVIDEEAMSHAEDRPPAIPLVSSRITR